MQMQTNQQTEMKAETKFSGSFWINLDDIFVLHSNDDEEFPSSTEMKEFDLDPESKPITFPAYLESDQISEREEKVKQEKKILFWVQKSFFCQMLRILFSQKYLVGFISKHNVKRSQILGLLEKDARLVELQYKLMNDTINFAFLNILCKAKDHTEEIPVTSDKMYQAIDKYLALRSWSLACSTQGKNIFYSSLKTPIDCHFIFKIDHIDNDLLTTVKNDAHTKKYLFNKKANCLSIISDFLFPQFLGLVQCCLVLNLDYIKINDYFCFGTDDASRKKICHTIMTNLANAKYLEPAVTTTNKYILKIARDRDAQIKTRQSELVIRLMHAILHREQFPDCAIFMLQAVTNYDIYLAAISCLEKFQLILSINSITGLEVLLGSDISIIGESQESAYKIKSDSKYQFLLNKIMSANWVKLFVQLNEKAIELRSRWFNSDPMASRILSEGLDVCSGYILEFVLNSLFKLTNLQKLSKEKTLAKLIELKDDEVLKRYRPKISFWSKCCCCCDHTPSTIKLIDTFYGAFSTYTTPSLNLHDQQVNALFYNNAKSELAFEQKTKVKEKDEKNNIKLAFS